jgi:hypothetical protein
MLTPFDSGGGVFIDVNGQYQLAGINSFTGVRIPNGNSDSVSTVTDSTGENAVQGTLYDTYGYYYQANGSTMQITTHTPESSFATQLSSKQNFIGEVDGTISSVAAAALPVDNDGLLTVYSNMTTGDITGDGSLEIGSGGTNATLQIAPNSGTSEIAGLSISSGSRLDITNNRVIIDGGANPSTETWLLKCLSTGFNGGQWNGPGIDSSTAGASSLTYGVAFADSNDSVVGGLTSDQAEIAYALYGDCNLDGSVNGEDFLILATNFNEVAPQGWEDGDFNYESTVNASDFLLLADNFDKASSTDWSAVTEFAAANDISLTGAVVPEPTQLIPLAAFSLIMMARRAHLRTPKPINC